MPVIKQAYSRGLSNNGWIEIEEDDSDDEDKATWREGHAFGRVFRLSAKGIKRDFISRSVMFEITLLTLSNFIDYSVYETRGQSDFQPRTAPNTASAVALHPPSMGEHEAALTLVQLAESQGNRAHQAARAMIVSDF